jgi:mannan endo-1,6-alpha-mannosidase
MEMLICTQTSSDIWRKRVQGHLDRFATFFVHEADTVNATNSAGGDILTEQTCAKITTLCSRDERYYKSLTARWMSHAAVAAPFIGEKIDIFLEKSATQAAKSCTGTEPGKMCGFWWETGRYVSDTTTSLAEEISALEVIQQNLNGPHIRLATVNSTISNPNVTPKPSGTGTSQGNDPSSTGANAAGRLEINAWIVVALLTLAQLV